MGKLLNEDDVIDVLDKYGGYIPRHIDQRIWEDMKKLPPAYSEPKWIPVSERLPEQKGEYLVTYHPCYWDNVQNDIKVGIDSFRGKSSWAKKKYQRVIAWMPLPEAFSIDARGG